MHIVSLLIYQCCNDDIEDFKCMWGSVCGTALQGKDDLRQDAVMQQVFSMVNSLLAKNAETRRRNLSVRTYKVIHLQGFFSGR